VTRATSTRGRIEKAPDRERRWRSSLIVTESSRTVFRPSQDCGWY